MADNAAITALRRRLDSIGIDKNETERDIREMENRLESANAKMEQLTKEGAEIRSGLRALGVRLLDVPPEPSGLLDDKGNGRWPERPVHPTPPGPPVPPTPPPGDPVG